MDEGETECEMEAYIKGWGCGDFGALHWGCLKHCVFTTILVIQLQRGDGLLGCDGFQKIGWKSACIYYDVLKLNLTLMGRQILRENRDDFPFIAM
ncbi:hypothetical protein SDJN03_04903, partial [Cucurbita argyrosperma subsp. sororia]